MSNVVILNYEKFWVKQIKQDGERRRNFSLTNTCYSTYCKLDTILSTLQILTHYPYNKIHAFRTVISILTDRKLSWVLLAQSHTASKWRSQNLKSGCLVWFPSPCSEPLHLLPLIWVSWNPWNCLSKCCKYIFQGVSTTFLCLLKGSLRQDGLTLLTQRSVSSLIIVKGLPVGIRIPSEAQDIYNPFQAPWVTLF